MRKIPNINTHIFKQPGIPWSVSGFSTEAAFAFALYDSLGDGLTTDEKTYMATYIDAEVANGNHALKDYETIYPLSGANALVDYIGGITATAVNAPIHSVNGYAFVSGSSQYINTNFNMATDSTNYTLNDALWGFYQKTQWTDVKAPIGVYTGTDFASIFKSGGNFVCFTNSASGLTISDVADRVLLMTRRTSTDTEIFGDGVSIINSNSHASTSIPAFKMYVGARNNAGVVNSPSTGTASYCLIGAAIGFDHVGHNTNLRAFLTSLGTI